jgi:hypothetical protein
MKRNFKNAGEWRKRTVKQQRNNPVKHTVTTEKKKGRVMGEKENK